MSFYNFGKAASKFENIITVGSLVVVLVGLAFSTGIASMYVPYTSGKQIRSGDNCVGFSSGEECDSNVALPSMAAALGLLGLVMVGVSVGLLDFLPIKSISKFFGKDLPMIGEMNMTGCVILWLAFVFSVASFGLQVSDSNPVYQDQLYLNGTAVGEQTPGFILSLVTMISYFIVVCLITFSSSESLESVHLACRR